MCHKKLRRDPENMELSLLPLLMFPFGRRAGFPGCRGPRGVLASQRLFPGLPSSPPHFHIFPSFSSSPTSSSSPADVTVAPGPHPEGVFLLPLQPSLPAQSLGGRCHLETHLWVALAMVGGGQR